MRMTSSGNHLELLPAAGGPPIPFLTGKGSEMNGQISPDGKWVAYASDESGDWEIYVTSFPGAAGKWQVSRGGGTEPRWRGDGKEIFYIAPSGILTAVPVNGEGLFATGTPAPLFQIRGRAPISSTDVFTYDVAKDGKRFLVNRYVKPEHVPPLTILLTPRTATNPLSSMRKTAPPKIKCNIDYSADCEAALYPTLFGNQLDRSFPQSFVRGGGALPHRDGTKPHPHTC